MPQYFVHLCHGGNATSEEIAATEAAAIANGYRPESLRARPVQRIGRTAAQPNGVEYGYGYTITWSYLRDWFCAASSIPGARYSPEHIVRDHGPTALRRIRSMACRRSIRN